jgi:hypothetical protein
MAKPAGRQVGAGFTASCAESVTTGAVSIEERFASSTINARGVRVGVVLREEAGC